jgi:hypothetical protein
MYLKSWKTTAAAICGGLGAALKAISMNAVEPTLLFGGVTLGGLGEGLFALAVAWGFLVSRDADVSSEGRKIQKKGRLP